MERKELLELLWDSQNKAYELMLEYDSFPHHYGNWTLYQSEAYVINSIGQTPDITTSELSAQLKKTPSACSQMVKKLIGKGLVQQERNPYNKRLYNLRLTPEGEELYQDHVNFNTSCKKNTFDMMSEFTEQELEICLKVQTRFNEAYQEDVRHSKEYYSAEC